MKIIHLIILFTLFTNCVRNTTKVVSEPVSENTQSRKGTIPKGMRKIHTLKHNDSTLMGEVYAKYFNDSLFTELLVMKESDTLYHVMPFYSRNQFGEDLRFYNQEFWGYRFVIAKNNYFVLSAIRKSGYDLGDYITVEWNEEKGVLELLLTP